MVSLSLWFAATANAAPTANAVGFLGPTVRVMPDGIKTPTTHTAYAWAGTALDVWGNVAWGDSASGSYVWDFGDGSPTAGAAVSNARDIVVAHTYAAAGTYYATLTVTDGNGESDAAQVRVDVLPVPDDAARINLAIERGLKRLYLRQQPGGFWYGSYSAPAAPTALAVLALENRGHRPISPDSDIYKTTVIDGLNYLFTALYWQTSIPYPGAPYDYDPDVNGNGGIATYWDDGDYVHGMIMSAIVAAGSYDSGYPKTDAVHNPALNLTVPALGTSFDGWRYYDVLDDMMEACAWAQADPGTGGRGGWRYSPNDGDSDNSIAQWFAIGLEGAELWGIIAPPWVKSELLNHWLISSYKSSVAGWGYSNSDYCTLAHSGAGLCMMAYVGIPKTDPWAVAAWNALAANWGGVGSKPYELQTYEGWGWDYWPSHFGPTHYWGTAFNSYAMYAVAKAARIARDSLGNVSEVVTFGAGTPVNWYADYSAFLLGNQQSDGSWPGYWYWDTDISTPFAILILEPTVASLRPQAALTASPNPVNALTTVNFDLSGSTHQDPAKFLMSWKLDFDASDGVDWVGPDASGAFPIVGTVPKVGGYPQQVPPADYDVVATVQVTDNDGETAEAVTIVRIRTGLVPPVADTGGPYTGRVGFPVTLDGSGSTDSNPGGSIVKYEWDLDGNGSYETDAGPSPTYPATWSTPYSGQIGLKVTDNFGLSSTASSYTSITVCDLQPVGYPLVAFRRLGRTTWEYTFRFVIQNVGTGDATVVSAELMNWPAQVSVVDGNAAFPGTVFGGGAPVVSGDTFTVRIDRSVPVQNSNLTWRLQFTDSAGTTWVLVNFPL